MKTIENSEIVDWSQYPEFICAIVMQTTRDLKSTKMDGLILPKGEEQIWLLDKPPQVIDGVVHIKNTHINCMGHYYSTGEGAFPYAFIELHFKPKPIIQIKQSNHKACEA